MTPSQKIARATCSADLRHIRRTIEAELIALAKAGTKFTQAHVGQMELIEACGEELDLRGALLPPPPFVDICHEDGIRYPTTVRVY